MEKTENFLGEWRTNKSAASGRVFLRAAYIREMLSYLCTEEDKSRTETMIYWARGGSWWPQLLLDRLLMSGSAAAMQVFIFCYENCAKSTGADAIKDRTALEGFHQMLSCFVTHTDSVPNRSFSGAEHLWFLDEFSSTFPLAQWS